MCVNIANVANRNVTGLILNFTDTSWERYY